LKGMLIWAGKSFSLPGAALRKTHRSFRTISMLPGSMRLALSVTYIVATLMVIIAFIKISKKSWFEILLIKKEDFQDYRNFLLELRSGILK